MKTQLRNFEQARDVLDYGIDLHGQLSAFYNALGQRSDQDRTRLVLDYLSRHERDRGETMKRFEEAPHTHDLDVWLQFAPSSDIERLLAHGTSRSDLSVDDVVGIAMRFDDALIEIYREAARQAEETRAKGIFDDLVRMETKEQQRLVRDAEWIQDF